MNVTPGFWGNLSRRVATAAVVLPPLIAVVFLAPPLVTVCLVAGAIVLGVREFFFLLEVAGVRPIVWAGWLGTTVAFLQASSPLGARPVWPLAVLLVLVGALRGEGDFAGLVPSAAGTLLGVAYLGALGGTIAGLRVLDPVDAGVWRVLLLLAIVMGSDTFAFFVGHAFGRRKLAPSLSPGKTLEGSAGGLAGGVAGALLVRRCGLPHLPILDAVTLGVVVSALGVLGDLFESLLKRWAGVKDSGAVFPGHGGMLDRMDSLLFAAPVLYYYFLYTR